MLTTHWSVTQRRCLLSSVSDTLDDIFDESGDEQETDAVVNQVLDEIGIEISGKVSTCVKINAASFHYSFLKQRFTSFPICSLLCVDAIYCMLPLFTLQMRDAPAAHKGALGESSKAAGMTDDDLERQLAQLKAL